MTKSMTMTTRRAFTALVFCAALFAFQFGTASAAEKIKALIIDGQNNHNWKGTTPELKSILEKSGRFSVDVATMPTTDEKKANKEEYLKNMAAFKPDFAKYGVIIGNFNTMNSRDNWSEETMKAFEQYIAGGGGYVSYHAADNAFPNWEAYNKMTALGGWDRNHIDAAKGKYLYWDAEAGKAVTNTDKGPRGGHGPQWAFAIDVREPNHPIMKGLPETFRHCPDELYSFMWGPAENVTILGTAFADKAKGGNGRHEPLLMAIAYEKGRIFHTMLGHDVKHLKSVSFIITFLRGAEWAATGQVTIPEPEDMPGKDTPVMRD